MSALGNRSSPATAPTGRPGNRRPGALYTQQASLARDAAAQVAQGSADSTGLSIGDIDIFGGVQGYDQKVSDYIAGQVAVGTRTITASGAVQADDYLILANATTGAIVLTLPGAAANNGRVLTVKKTDAGANTVTVDGSGAETIDGAATHVLALQYDTVTVISDGTGWARQ